MCVCERERVWTAVRLCGDCRADLTLIIAQDALKALLKLNDKPLRGRKLVVTYASQVRVILQLYNITN